jgi:hypothetical protein
MTRIFVTGRGPVNGRQAIEKWYTDLYKGWHPKTTSSSSMGMPLTLQERLAMRCGQPENEVRLVKARPADLFKSRAIGQGFIFVRTMIGSSGC